MPLGGEYGIRGGDLTNICHQGVDLGIGDELKPNISGLCMATSAILHFRKWYRNWAKCRAHSNLAGMSI